jgi:hypothetical protein
VERRRGVVQCELNHSSLHRKASHCEGSNGIDVVMVTQVEMGRGWRCDACEDGDAGRDEDARGGGMLLTSSSLLRSPLSSSPSLSTR